jgi:hypothetical protein
MPNGAVSSIVVAVVVLAVAVIAEAQEPKVVRIGFLGPTSAASNAERMEALRTGLRELGYLEGKNLVIESRWAEGKFDRLPELAAELVRLNVDVILTAGTPGIRAAKMPPRRFLSSWYPAATRSPLVLSPAWRGREGMSPDRATSPPNSVRNGSNCLRKPCRGYSDSVSSLIRPIR